MSALFAWLQDQLHRECDRAIAFHDEDRRRAEQAQTTSAEAHHEAEEALAEERTTVARLENELATAQARAEQAEAAREEALDILRRPLSLDPTRYASALVAAELHHIMLWFGLTELAIRMERSGATETAATLREMAETHRLRMNQAYEALSGTEHTDELRERLERLIVEPLLPSPGAEHAQGQETAA